MLVEALDNASVAVTETLERSGMSFALHLITD